MTTTTSTPEHLQHHEYETQPFTGWELAGIAEYENRSGDIIDCLVGVEHLAQRTEETTTDGDGFTAEQTKSMDRACILAAFDWLREWYGALDSLKSALRNGEEGPAHSGAGASYLRQECTDWYRKLHQVRREACKYAFGTAGPQPEVDSGYLTFFDIPGVQLDGTIAAESQ
jgi:hypothetical protein